MVGVQEKQRGTSGSRKPRILVGAENAYNFAPTVLSAHNSRPLYPSDTLRLDLIDPVHPARARSCGYVPPRSLDTLCSPPNIRYVPEHTML